MTADQRRSILTVQDLRVTFDSPAGPLRAVDGVDLSVAAGQTVALVGESGCGKTMTALAILGLVPSDGNRTVSGRITFDGQELQDLSRRHLRRLRGAGISMVFQDPVAALNPVFSIGDQICEVLRAHEKGLSKRAARDRVIDLLDRVGIPDAAGRVDGYPHQWSGGMCQRAVIAMAIANRPKLLIADEPTTALDVTVQARVLEVLRQAQAETGAAVLMITHDLGVVAEMADRVVMMYAGRVVEEAAVSDIFGNARHPYTRGLLASLPSMEGAHRLVSIPGLPPQLHKIASGCAFHPRCALGDDREICRARVPELVTIGHHGGRSACHFSDEVGAVTRLPRNLPDDVGHAYADEVAEPILQLESVVVHFPIRSALLGREVGAIRAVDGVSLELWAGETVGLVGESGCGKSTTAAAIMRLQDANSGRILFEGRDLAGVSGSALREVRRGIQMVFQDPQASLDPKMPIGASIAEPLRIHGTSQRDADKRVLELLEMVGLDRIHLARYPHQFSGGQLQRVGIARALALEPRVVILDEPVSALDVSIQAQILNLLARLQAELGLAYLMIAHDLSVVRHVADRVAVMYLGRIVETGPTAALYDAPQHPYTKALLDAVPLPDPSQRDRPERIVLSDDLPDPANPPSGCHFRTRCWKAEQRCAEFAPELTAHTAPQRPVACHFPE